MIRGMSAEDLLIPSQFRDIGLNFRLCEGKKIPQITITNTNNSVFAKNAEVVLMTSVDSLSFSNSLGDYLFHRFHTTFNDDKRWRRGIKILRGIGCIE